MKKQNALVVMILLGVPACINPAQVQKNYIATRDECRARAEGQEGSYVEANQGLTDRDRNSVLASLFSDCMFQMGWTVATPPRAGGGDDGGGIIETARKKPTAEAAPGQAGAQTGNNVTLQPSPLPLSPAEDNTDLKNAPPTTQFPNSTYQSHPLSSPYAKGNAAVGGVSVVTPSKNQGMQANPTPLKVKKATTISEKEGMTPEQQKMILDNLAHPR